MPVSKESNTAKMHNYDDEYDDDESDDNLL